MLFSQYFLTASAGDLRARDITAPASVPGRLPRTFFWLTKFAMKPLSSCSLFPYDSVRDTGTALSKTRRIGGTARNGGQPPATRQQQHADTPRVRQYGIPGVRLRASTRQTCQGFTRNTRTTSSYSSTSTRTWYLVYL